MGFPVLKVRNKGSQSNRIKMSHILQGKSLDLFYYGKLNNKVEEFGISRIGKLSEVPKGPSQTM